MGEFLKYGGFALLWVIMTWGVWAIGSQLDTAHGLGAVVFSVFASMVMLVMASIGKSETRR